MFFCDNFSTLCLSKYPMHHSKAKHIDIKHNFIRNHVLNGNVEIIFLNTVNQLADIFTKPFLKKDYVILENP